MKPGYFLFICALSLFSCRHEKRSAPPVSKDTEDSHRFEQRESLEQESIMVTQDTVFAAPLSITAKDLQWKDLTLPDPLNPDTILLRLFPGRFGTSEFSNRAFVLWDCPKCSIRSFDGWLVEDPQFFPNPGGVETDIVKTYRYREESMERVAIFFSSHEVRQGDPGTGRFTCGILGAALFQKSKNGEWDLLSFEPAVDCTGSYSEARSPDTMRIGKKIRFLLEDANGGTGAPMIGKYSLYGFVGRDFKSLLTVEDGSLEYGLYGWSTVFNFLAGKSDNPEIIAVTSGIFDEETSKELRDYQLSKPFPKILEDKNHNAFTVTRTYRFGGSHYYLAKENIDVFTKKLEW